MDDPRTEWQKRIGVGERQVTSPSAFSPTKTTSVIADDGPMRGTVVGKQRHHKSGRVDAKATAVTTVHPNLQARRVNAS